MKGALKSRMAAPALQSWRRLALAAVVAGAFVLAASPTRPLQGQTPPPATAALGDQIPLRGLDVDRGGVVLWNAGVGAPEPQKTGHATPWTTCSTSAPYYLATRDFSDLDPTSSAGFHGLPLVQGLPGLTAALTVGGFLATDLTVSWFTQALGADQEDADWFFDPVTNVETRYYSGGTFAIKLRGELLVGGRLPATTVTIAYNNLSDCSDDVMSAKIAAVIPDDRTGASRAPNAAAIRAVAAALLSDLSGHGIAFALDSLQPASSPLTATGRAGSFFEVSSGHIEVDAVCSCAIGIHETDDTHEWELRWPDPTLPLDGPVRLKVVASTPAPSTPPPSTTSGGANAENPAAPPGFLAVTVFDESAPTVGVILDLPYPAVKGDVAGWVELDILPQKRYVFTLRHTGAGRHYSVGTSHPRLMLGQSDQRYLPGASQDWALDAVAGESLQLELLTLTPGAPQPVSFQNTGADRRLRVQVDPDGAFRMKRVGGDMRLYSLACPLRDGPETPILTVTDAGVTPNRLQIDVGQQFLLVNRSSANRQISSNRHPIHTDCPPLNQPGFLPPGASGLSGIFNTARSYGFHDHQNPIDRTMRGEIVIGAAGS